MITNIIVEGGVYSGLGFCYFVGSTISLMLALLSVVEVYYLVWEGGFSCSVVVVGT